MLSLDVWTLSGVITKAMIYGTCLLASGSALFAIFFQPTDREIRSTLRYTISVCVCFAFLLSALDIGLRAGFLMDDGFVGMVDPVAIKMLTDGAFGQALIFRYVGLVVLLLSVLVIALLPWLAGLGALLIALSFSLTGHATGEPRWALTLLICLHVLTISYWLGGLLPLYRLAGRERKCFEAVQHAQKFGTHAVFLLPILFVAGVGLSFFLVGNVKNMVATDYGLTLLGKIVVAVLLLGLGAVNKLRFVPAMARQDRNAKQNFRHVIRWEAAAFISIFVVSAFLTSATTLPKS